MARTFAERNKPSYTRHKEKRSETQEMLGLGSDGKPAKGPQIMVVKEVSAKADWAFEGREKPQGN